MLSNTSTSRRLPCYDEITKKLKTNKPNISIVEPIYDKVKHRSVDQLAKKIEQLPNITNSSIVSRKSSAFTRPIHSSSFVSEINHRGSYLNILKAMDMSSDSTGTFNDVRI